MIVRLSMVVTIKLVPLGCSWLVKLDLIMLE